MNLIKRIATAIILIPIVLGCFLMGGMYAFSLILLMSLVALYEYSAFVFRSNYAYRVLFISFGGIFCFLNACFQGSFYMPFCFILLAFIAASYFTLVSDQNPAIWEKIGALFFGIVYIVFGLSSIYWLRSYDFMPDSNLGAAFVFLTFIVIWSNDSFAYFVGRFFGRRKLLTHVSPKKTWEGFWAGAVGGVITPFIVQKISIILGINIFSNIMTQDILVISIPGIILVPLSDLIESAIKRAYKVKDSGSILPGHGGVLDRIDSLLFIFPWTFFYVLFLRGV